MTDLNIVLVDDHQLVRTGLRQTIGAEPGLKIRAECQLGREVLLALRQHSCHVLLLDLSLPDMSGLDVLRQVRLQYPKIAVLVISGYPESQFGINVLRAGASGFISKGADSAELIRAIHTVARGNRYVGPELADILVNGLDARRDGPLHATLSEREFHIFCNLAQGVSNTEIARQLSLSVKTISTYRARVLEKMGFRTNADLTAYALKCGLIS